MTAETLPTSVDLTHHLSQLARSRQPSPLKDIIKYMFHDPDMISFAGGLPHSSLFPFHSISSSIFPASSTIDPADPAEPTDKIDLEINRSSAEFNLAGGLQYTGGAGLAPLNAIVKDWTRQIQLPAYADWDILLNSGSTDGWSKVLALLVESGESVITESQIYPAAQAAFVPMGVNALPIDSDNKGLRPDALAEALENWDESKGRRPHVMYLVPVGQNPLGTTMDSKRRQEIYDVCCKYDVIIVEDDPYTALQFEPFVFGAEPVPQGKTDTAAFLKTIERSFLTFDTEGRVIRLDTFSKTLAPGARLGWFTANAKFIERLLRGTEVQTQAANGFSQVIIGSLLTKWGVNGYLEWCANLCETYRVRRDWMLSSIADNFDVVAADKSGVAGALGHVCFPKGTGPSGPPIMSFTPPTGGMFIWATIYYTSHPAWSGFAADFEAKRAAAGGKLFTIDVGDDQPTVVDVGGRPERYFEEKIWRACIAHKILLTPGWYYTPWEGATGVHSAFDEGAGHFRLAYSFESKAQMVTGMQRMAEVLTSEWTGKAL